MQVVEPRDHLLDQRLLDVDVVDRVGGGDAGDQGRGGDAARIEGQLELAAVAASPPARPAMSSAGASPAKSTNSRRSASTPARRASNVPSARILPVADHDHPLGQRLDVVHVVGGQDAR